MSVSLLGAVVGAAAAMAIGAIIALFGG